MNNTEKYTRFALTREMMETPEIIRNFVLKGVADAVSAIKSSGKILFSGEGSSRIFPAKNAICSVLREGMDLNLACEGGLQALEYDLSDFTVFGASNSGQTKEVILLFNRLKENNHKALFALTANRGTKLEALAKQTFVLSCGKEDAVAATKSVAEQALFYQALLWQMAGESIDTQLGTLADAFAAALTTPIEPKVTEKIANAGTIYFAGRNNGVAEELTLKTNEITRKKSDFLEGTYAVHGIEEVMNPDDVVIFIDPFETEFEKIQQTLVRGVGMTVIAVANKPTPIPTIVVPSAGKLTNFVYLAAGWNLLVEVGMKLGIHLDTPVRARKVGNEMIG